ncbi:MAG: M14 family zinc carboxypeptidase, partial [Bacteroidota bacterium]
MKLGKVLLGIFCGLLCTISGISQQLQPPEAFLDYEIGENFTYHYRMVEYFRYIAANSSEVELIPYGSTYEDRPLLVAAISSPENINQLEDIRQANLYAAGLSSTPPQAASQIPIVWFGFNVHGNEAAGMETAIRMLYTLVTQDTLNWLEDMVILIDPCLNPDGRDRYTNWYRQATNTLLTPKGNSYEHHEPWPGGRYNHYLFDLNRDWAWQSQKESKSRTVLYQQWMPHVAVDFHEMGANSPFFFGPAAKPLHEVITPWQRTFQRLVGRGNARYFDERGWLYFTHEVYDLLYPSYGDTWPTYNGAIGFTYEQGGSGVAGKGYIIASGDTLFLSDRIEHHFISGWATLETTHKEGSRLLEEFNSYFRKGREAPSDPYRSYVVTAKDNPPERLRAFCQLLDVQGIQYGHPRAGKGTYRGYSYQSGQTEDFEVDKADILISSYQSKSRLVQVLMEPETFLEDSITYDLTAWALPYVYDLVAFATEERLETRTSEVEIPFKKPKAGIDKPYAWLLRWQDFQSTRFLSHILREKIRVRYAEKPFAMGKESFDAGTLIITRTDNPLTTTQAKLLQIAEDLGLSLYPVASGKVDEGNDFGSRNVSYLDPPRIALINGEGVSPTAFGELWHYFEQDLAYPIE